MPALPQDRMLRIIQTADDILRMDGLDGLTVRAVLARANLARRAFYECFASKDDLMLAVLKHSLAQATAEFRANTNELTDPLDKLRLTIKGIVLGSTRATPETSQQAMRHGAAMTREHLRLAELRLDELQRALAPLLDLIASLLAEGMAQDKIRQGEPRRMAILIYNLVATTVHTVFLSPEIAPAERSQLAQEVWEFCRRAIVADGPATRRD